MAHTPSPRTSSSATGAARPAVDHGPRRSRLRALRWQIRDDLVRARRFYDLNPGALRLLNAMLAFVGSDELVCFAKNEKISAKADGMSARSISRHAMQLGKLGFLVRNDSPNFKRGVRRSHKKAEVYYGFDLTPFFERAAEFKRRAQEADDQDVALRLTLDRLTALRLRLEALDAEPELAAEIRRARRWELSPALPGLLSDLERRAQAALAALKNIEEAEGVATPALLDESFPSPAPGSSTVQAALGALGPLGDLIQAVANPTEPPADAEEMATNDSHSGRQYQSRYDRVFSSPSGVVPDADLTENRIAMRLGSEDRSPYLRSTVAEPDAPGKDVGTPLPSPDQRHSMSAYVQSVLAGFRHKLGNQTRPRLDATPEHPPSPASTPAAASVRAATIDVVSRQQEAVDDPAAAPFNGRAARHEGASRRTSPHTDGLPTVAAVLEACPEGAALTGARPATWSQMFDAAWRLGGWIGIPPAILAKACARLGREGLAVTLFGIYERLSSVREPTAYLLSVSARPEFRPVDLLPRPNLGGATA